MGNVIFDYNALEDAKSNAKKIVTGWNCLDDYKAGLSTKLGSSLDEWRLSKQEPYGHTYISNAKQEIADKITELDTIRTQWINLSSTIENFLQYIKNRDSQVVNIFKTTSSQYTDYSGIGGVFNYLGDSWYNFWAVDVANSNGFTRAISDWGKKAVDDLSHVIQQADDWFRHGNGRYVLNIVGSIALTAVAIVGTVVAIVGIPFTGGTSAAIAVGCIGALASAVAAGISAYNTYYTINENTTAMTIVDDPGMARFHGDVSKYSDYVEKTDFGSKEANDAAARKAKTIDTVHACAETVSFATSLATTLGTTTIVTGVDEYGDDIVKTTLDFSSGNVKNNVLKTFGFNVDSKTITVDELEINKTTIISNADEIGDTTIGVTRASGELDYKSAALEKTIDVADNGKKTVTKTLTINNANVSTEYGSVVASNNVVTQEFSIYASHAEASSTVIDYTKAAKITPSKTLEAFQTAFEKPNLKNDLVVAQEGFKLVGTGTAYLKASDENRTETLVQNLVKTNHFASQVDKYILKVDVSKDDNKFYVGGDGMKKVSTLWTTLTEPAT